VITFVHIPPSFFDLLLPLFSIAYYLSVLYLMISDFVPPVPSAMVTAQNARSPAIIPPLNSVSIEPVDLETPVPVPHTANSGLSGGVDAVIPFQPSFTFEDYVKIGLNTPSIGLMLASKNISPDQVVDLTERDIRDLTGQDFGARLTLMKFVKLQSERSSNTSKLSIVKSFETLPRDLNIWPAKLDPVKILREPNSYYDLESLSKTDSKHCALVKYLLVLLGSISARNECQVHWSSPLIYLIRAFSTDGFEIDSRVRNSWSSLALSDAEILKTLTCVDPSILISRRERIPISGLKESRPNESLIAKPMGICVKLAKFGNCLGEVGGHQSCKFSHDQNEIGSLRAKNPGWPITPKRPFVPDSTTTASKPRASD
jgi:hypothetical protein